MNILFLGGVLMWYVADAMDLNPAIFCDDELVLSDIVEGLARSERGFSFEVYKAASQQHNGSIAVSPLATYLGMSKIYFGADERTREAMMKSINISCNCIDSQFGFQDLSRKIQNVNGPELRVTNQIFYQPGLKLRYHFAKIMESVFHSIPQDFRFNTTDANFKLKEIILQNHPGLGRVSIKVNQSDSLILVDTSTYTQQWANINSSCSDTNRIFHDKHLTEIEYVHKTGQFIYGALEIAGVKVTYVGIPSEGISDKVYMFAILPEQKDASLDAVQNNIDADVIHKMIIQSTKKLVHVALPELDISFSADITNALRQMSGDGPFSNATDLYKITTSSKIHVDRVLHFSRIQLKPVCGSRLCPDKSAQYFQANYPFVIVIATMESNPLILLMGHYTGPDAYLSKNEKKVSVQSESG